MAAKQMSSVRPSSMRRLALLPPPHQKTWRRCDGVGGGRPCHARPINPYQVPRARPSLPPCPVGPPPRASRRADVAAPRRDGAALSVHRGRPTAECGGRRCGVYPCGSPSPTGPHPPRVDCCVHDNTSERTVAKRASSARPSSTRPLFPTAPGRCAGQQ